MSAFECPREQDVLDALSARRWPARSDDELRAHVAGCSMCADLVAVAGALLDDDPAGGQDLPPASLVWWRAQLRAREESARAALRPIRAAQLAAGICATVFLLVALRAVLPALAAPAGEALLRTIAIVRTSDLRAAIEPVRAALAYPGVQLAAGAWLVLAPVAAYLAFSRD